MHQAGDCKDAGNAPEFNSVDYTIALELMVRTPGVKPEACVIELGVVMGHHLECGNSFPL